MKTIKSGLLVECTSEKPSSCLFKSKTFPNIPVKVTPHSFLNFSKGVIRCRDLEGISEEEICENVSSQNVTAVRQITIGRNNDLLPTNTFIITFNITTLPGALTTGYLIFSKIRDCVMP